jgi:hypothetical protein
MDGRAAAETFAEGLWFTRYNNTRPAAEVARKLAREHQVSRDVAAACLEVRREAGRAVHTGRRLGGDSLRRLATPRQPLVPEPELLGIEAEERRRVRQAREKHGAAAARRREQERAKLARWKEDKADKAARRAAEEGKWGRVPAPSLPAQARREQAARLQEKGRQEAQQWAGRKRNATLKAAELRQHNRWAAAGRLPTPTLGAGALHEQTTVGAAAVGSGAGKARKGAEEEAQWDSEEGEWVGGGSGGGGGGGAGLAAGGGGALSPRLSTEDSTVLLPGPPMQA